MKTETFRVTVAHDNGTTRFQVLSSAGLACVINQVMKAEQCPESAIICIKREVKPKRKKTIKKAGSYDNNR